MKNINFKCLLVSGIAGIMLFFSCAHKEKVTTPQTNNTSILSIIEKYYKLANTKGDGTFMFESNLTNNDSSLSNTVLAGGIFYDKSGNTQDLKELYP